MAIFFGLNSDDLYHKSFIQQLHDFNDGENIQILINKKAMCMTYIMSSLQQFHSNDPHLIL